LSDEQLAASARLLRRYHDAIAGSALPGGAEVVCHHDYGPWNLVWRDERPVAIIELRFADGYGIRPDGLLEAIGSAQRLLAEDHGERRWLAAHAARLIS
jgi:phosphotransferase family enzyme